MIAPAVREFVVTEIRCGGEDSGDGSGIGVERRVAAAKGKAAVAVMAAQPAVPAALERGQQVRGAIFGERYAPRPSHHVIDIQFDISNAPSISIWGARGCEVAQLACCASHVDVFSSFKLDKTAVRSYPISLWLSLRPEPLRRTGIIS